MSKVNIHEAKTQLSNLLQRVSAGEEITIANRGIPVARLVPLEQAGGRRRLGIEHNRIRISDDFDASLAHKVLASFLSSGQGERTAAGDEVSARHECVLVGLGGG